MPLAGLLRRPGGHRGSALRLRIQYGGTTGHRFFRYNPATNGWVTRAAPPSRHRSPAAGVIGGKFYRLGVRLTALPPTWLCMSITRRPTPGRAGPLCRWVRRGWPVPWFGGKLYAAGGVNAAITMDSLRVYDPGTNRWTNKALMPTERSDSRAQRQMDRSRHRGVPAAVIRPGKSKPTRHSQFLTCQFHTPLTLEP
jgi:Kelch motif